MITKTIQRAIESRQKQFDKKHPYISNIKSLQKDMDDLISKGYIVVGGRQGNHRNSPDSTWDYYVLWIQVVNIFNRYCKTHRIDSIHIPANSNTKNVGGYWTEQEFILKEL